MSSGAAYIVKEILTEVVRSGAGGYAAIPGISVGVKTGTSQDDADRWFCDLPHIIQQQHGMVMIMLQQEKQ